MRLSKPGSLSLSADGSIPEDLTEEDHPCGSAVGTRTKFSPCDFEIALVNLPGLIPPAT